MVTIDVLNGVLPFAIDGLVQILHPSSCANRFINDAYSRRTSKSAVMLPKAQRNATRSLSIKSNSRSMAPAQSWLPADAYRRTARISLVASFRSADISFRSMRSPLCGRRKGRGGVLVQTVDREVSAGTSAEGACLVPMFPKMSRAFAVTTSSGSYIYRLTASMAF
jgi:hypothetical protein